MDHPETLGCHPLPPRGHVVVVWWLALFYLTMHLLFLYSIYVTLFLIKLATTVWTMVLLYIVGVSITIGAHRLYSHRSFKAHPFLRLALVLLFTATGQRSMYTWVRNHRLHHKFTDTDADPHNANRGFFYSHVGWLMCRKQPERKEKERKLDMSDIEGDWFVMFQKRYYTPLFLLVGVLIPAVVPCWLWAETPVNSFMSTVVMRIVLAYNITWCVNSVAHAFGTRPYTRNFLAAECPKLSAFALGEGWHNYHHTFPWDYRASELGRGSNISTSLIDVFHRLGWVWDLRQPTPDMVRHRVLRHGDGTHPLATPTD